MRLLVTGGAGFIGHHLVRAGIARGDDVTVLDNFATGLRARLDPLSGQFTMVEGSILDRAALDAAMAGREVILHQAAIPSVARSTVNPRATNEANVTGTIELMLAAADHGIRRVVFAGSSSVYGGAKELPTPETLRPNPRSPYGASKLAGEHYIHTLGALHGIETVVLRYFNVFGPGQDPNSEYAAVVPKFSTAVLQGRQPTIYGSGDISRDFTYVDNVVSANYLAADQRGPAEVTCNIACGERHSLRDLLQIICDAAGRQVEPLFGPPRAGDVAHSLADVSTARDALGYRVVVPFAEGIARTVAWYRDELARAVPATPSPGAVPGA